MHPQVSWQVLGDTHSQLSVHTPCTPQNEYLGLAPFLRASIAGVDMRAWAQKWLDSSNQLRDDSVWLMNMSLVLQCLSEKDLGLSFQEQAFDQTRVFTIEPRQSKAEITLLSLMFPGDIASNTPIECLLENERVRIVQYFLCPENLFTESIPDHDVCYVAFSESVERAAAIQRLSKILDDWPKPVINQPQYVQNTRRTTASRLLRDVPGLQPSQAIEVSSLAMHQFAQNGKWSDRELADVTFPFIIRPAGSHAGVGLERLSNADELVEYLGRNRHSEYCVGPFIDYSSGDGYFRKYRLAVIDGRAYACHMGISKDWMIHYVNAGMYEDAWKRSQEAAFFDSFDQFARRHNRALRELRHRIGLDYFCVDCGETKSGELLVFEVDHCMVVHDMDLPELFPYKAKQMKVVREAFVDYLEYADRLSSSKQNSRHQSRLLNAQNFSGGPGVMPECVLEQLSDAVECVPNLGMSLLGVSHRSDWFRNLVVELERDILSLLELDDSYRVLFIQGGATQQFSMIPVTLLTDNDRFAEYLHCGYWSGKSIEEASRFGNVEVVWSGEKSRFVQLPALGELHCSQRAAYFHYVSNETVEGLQFHETIDVGNVPLVCDMSSDFLSRPIDARKYSIIYAHAQKNLGPAGVTIVVLRKDILDRCSDKLPSCLNYRVQSEHDSIYNTPPVMAIYTVHLVVKWLIEQVQGLAAMEQLNLQKAKQLYSALDDNEQFYRPRVHPANRSLMNATFTLPTRELKCRFLKQAEFAGFSGLKGHRTLGGIRASLYNGMTLSAVQNLIGFMSDFQASCLESGHWRAASRWSEKRAA